MRERHRPRVVPRVVRRVRRQDRHRVLVGGADRGSATVEFVTIGLLLMVPLVYLVVTMARIQAATFAVDGSAREAARAYTTADDDDDGRRRAAIAVRLGLDDHGFDRRDGTLTVSCGAVECLRPGRRVEVQVVVRVVLPLVPRFFDRIAPTSVVVRATQVAVVDEFRAVPG